MTKRNQGTVFKKNLSSLKSSYLIMKEKSVQLFVQWMELKGKKKDFGQIVAIKWGKRRKKEPVLTRLGSPFLPPMVVEMM